MAQQRRNPRDFTGAQAAKLAAQHAEVLKAREQEIGMATAAASEMTDEVTDLVKDNQIQQTDEKGEVTYVEAPAKTIRVNTTIEQMTFGVGNHYTFEEGQLYRVPAHVASYLEELGYVWH